MAAFAASFLNADPFLSSAAQPGNTQDSLGNIFNSAGQHIGVVPGSVADLGSKGVTPAQPSSSASAIWSGLNSAGSSVWSGLNAAGSAIWGTSKAPYSESVVENVVFIVIGLVLIAAAVFSFKPSHDLAVGISKKAAEVAAA
jgi:hypothetical protein